LSDNQKSTYLEPQVIDNRYESLNVIGLVADETACGNYRIIAPFWYLRKYGAKARWTTLVTVDEIMSADLVIVQRQYDPIIVDGLLKEAREAGKAIIYEIDDNLHAVLPSSPVYQVFKQGGPALAGVHRAIAQSHGLTVSTPELAGDYSKLNQNVEVIYNSIDFEMRDWETIPKDKDKDNIVVGWTGGVTHLEDVELLKNVIPAILEKYKNVKFALYTSLDLARLIIERLQLPEDRITIIPPRSFHDYPTALGYFDISLVPTVNCRFNAAKSNLKVLELGALGIPSVASKVPPYVTTIRNGVNGFTAETEPEWINYISLLIENEELRKKLGMNIRYIVYKHFNLGTNCHLWPEAWKAIIQRAAEGKKKVWPVLWGNVQRNDPCPCGSGKKYKKCECYPAYGR